jgi:N-acetylmuramoyl-L-alanine amidase
MRFGVILDPAHGSNVAGKGSPDGIKGNKESKYYFREYQWSREFCKYYLEPRLKSYGVQVFYTVDPDNEYEPGLSKRVEITNQIIKEHPDIHFIFVSPHVNAAGDGKEYKVATGWCLYTTKGENNSDILADCMMTKAEDNLPLLSKKIRKYKNEYMKKDMEADFTVIYGADCPAVLTENFFQDCKSDVLWLKSNEAKEVLCEIHVDGILDYFKLKYPDEI